MSDATGLRIWLNGKLVEAAEARIDPADRGFLLGDGLFETMRAVDGKVPLLDRHVARLAKGCELLGLIPPRLTAVAAAVECLLAADGLASAAVRLTLTRGPAARGLLPPAEASPTLMLAAFPLPSAAASVKARVARCTRRNEHSPLSAIKALGYLDQILALREVRAAGAEEALLLNTAGRLACASAANVFLVIDGRLLTPPVAEGALPGITRGLVLELAGADGLMVEERRLDAASLHLADEAFVTSSLRLVTPLADIDGRAIAPGPVGGRIGLALRAVAGA